MAVETGEHSNSPTGLPFPKSGSGFYVMGQFVGYPKTIGETTAVCVMFILLGWIAYLLIVPGDSKIIDAWRPQSVIYSNGEPVDQETFQFAFWTPGADTVRSILEFQPSRGDNEARLGWQRMTQEEEEKKLYDFGNMIRGSSERLVNGYRRVKIAGHGKSDYKTGWWWTVSVKKGYNVDQFVAMYLEYWRPEPKDVYIERLEWDYGYGK